MQTPQLEVPYKLPVLSFNFDQLKAWATALTERYANLVVTEDAIADVKRDMAELNKARKAVDDARKEAVRQVSEPIRIFEIQVKEICYIFETAYCGLSNQVKAFEDAQREEKKRVVMNIVQEEGAKCGEADPWQIVFMQERWLNKTASLASIRKDIAAIFARHIEEEQRKQALEQARQDRAAAIENQVMALNDKHGLNIPLSRFIVGAGANINTPLSEVLAGINQVFARTVQQREAEKAAQERLSKTQAPSPQPTAAKAAADIQQSVPAPEEQPGEPAAAQAQTRTISAVPGSTPRGLGETRAMSIVLEYEATREAQVNACLETLKSLCVNFGARCR